MIIACLTVSDLIQKLENLRWKAPLYHLIDDEKNETQTS